MDVLGDIITYVRRIIKSPSNAQITDALIIDFINRFYINDVDARMQLFDLKTKYQFQTTPGIADYNMPTYSTQTEAGGQTIASYPVYQGFTTPVYVDGIQTFFMTQRNEFFQAYPNYIQSLNQAATGDGSVGPYTITLPFFPAIPGHVDMNGIIQSGSVTDPIFGSSFNTGVPVTSVYAGVYFNSVDTTGRNIVVSDSGQFLSGNTGGDLYGLLIAPGKAPFGNTSLSGGYSTTSNTVNYATGVATVTFPTAIPDGNPIQAQCYFYQQGIPRAILFFNNTLTLRPPPDVQYLVELDAYLTPAAFLSSSAALAFGYMAEYIARGAARKILSDTGDIEQFQFYEPLFIEQEQLVWKRSQRIFTSTRTGTIFTNAEGQSPSSWGQGSY